MTRKGAEQDGSGRRGGPRVGDGGWGVGGSRSPLGAELLLWETAASAPEAVTGSIEAHPSLDVARPWVASKRLCGHTWVSI